MLWVTMRKTASMEFKVICCRRVYVWVYCMSVCQRRNCHTYHARAQSENSWRKSTNLATFGSCWHPKIWLWRLATFGATLGEFSVYFVVIKLLILAYFSDTNLTDFLIKICWRFKMCKNLWISWIFKIYNIIILNVYRFAVIWKLPF